MARPSWAAVGPGRAVMSSGRWVPPSRVAAAAAATVRPPLPPPARRTQPAPRRHLLLLPPAAAYANLAGGVPDKGDGQKKAPLAAAGAAAAAAWDVPAPGHSPRPPPPPPPPPGCGGADPSTAAAAAAAAATGSTTPDDDDAPFESPAERAALARELRTVSVAIGANALIFAAKLGAYAATGSAAMLAEAVHSIVDTANQALLRVGVTRSRRAPTAAHPYGYMKDKFVWALVSAVGIFCLGAGATVAHGVQALLDPAPGPPPHLGWGLAVLGVSAVVEGYSLAVAARAVHAGAAAAGLPFREYVARGVDPTSVAVMLEDGAAVVGLAIAAAATAATAATGSPLYDAAGSLAVGLLMGCTAAFLIQQNRSLLIGRAMHPVDMQRVLNHLARDPVVRAVFDAKSEEIGPGIFRFKAEIEFDGARVVARHLARLGGPAAVAAPIRAAVNAAGWGGGGGGGSGRAGPSGGGAAPPTAPAPPPPGAAAASDAALDAALASYGQDMVGALGAEVDRIEASIRAFMPAIRHIDLEADRGRAGALGGGAGGGAGGGGGGGGEAPPPGPPPPPSSASRPPPPDIASLSDPSYVFKVAEAGKGVVSGGEVGGWAGSGGASGGEAWPPPPPPPPPPTAR